MSGFVTRPMVVALIVACGLFMENLDGTVITTALPTMAASFGDTPARLSLGVTVYMISLAIFIPISGWVADRFGARTVFRAAIAVFTVGSVLCGLTHNLLELAGARIVQGIGGAMMVPVGRLILLRSVSKSELVRAMAYLTVPALLGPVLGPPVGGFITTYANWRWIFFLNVPIGILGMVLVTLLIDNTKEASVPDLDWFGFLSSGGALAGLVYGLDLIGRPLVPADVIVGILAAAILLGAITVWHALRHPHPLIDLALLRVPSYCISILGGSLFRIGSGTLPFLLPIMLQVGFGVTAFTSGLLTCAAAMGSFTMKMAARPILRRFGFRRVLIGNGIISALSITLCATFWPTTPHVVILAALLVSGFFRSLQYTSLNTVAYAEIGHSRMSAATSAASMMQQLSNGLGVAFGALLLQIARHWSGELTVADFHAAFGCAGLVALVAVVIFLRLDPAAGAEISGHRVATSDIKPSSA
ncbi:MAG: MFS transporter [Alphaproteobacteria bacterium]|nr:MFS transporter [Alphaproteobacteria bacterium]